MTFRENPVMRGDVQCVVVMTGVTFQGEMSFNIIETGNLNQKFS